MSLPELERLLSFDSPKPKPKPKPKPRKQWVGGYAYIERHTKNKARLKRLHVYRIPDHLAEALVLWLCERFDIPPVTLSLTGRRPSGEGGHFIVDETRIVASPRPVVEVIVHEVAHHYIWNKMKGGRKVPHHGADFVRVLDMLAEATELEWYRVMR